MTELSFSKSFLATLSQRPQRLAPDFCEDPRKLPSRLPYTLPRTLLAKPKRTTKANDDGSVKLTLKPLRATAGMVAHTFPSLRLSTSVMGVKAQYAAVSGVDPARLRVLFKGKPAVDVKTLAELGMKDGEAVTGTLMLMAGGVGSPGEVEMKDAPSKTKALAAGSEFWGELRKFLDAELGGEDVEEDAEVVFKAFKEAWMKKA